MQLENLSIKELKSLCKSKGMPSTQYAYATRPDLIRLLNSLENPKEQEELVKMVAKIVKKTKPKDISSTEISEEIEEIEEDSKPLSAQGLKWKKYLKSIKTTPQEYLLRFPDHVYKRFIEELI